MKIVKWGLAVAVLMVVAGLVALYAYLQATLPDYEGNQSLAGIQQEVDIIRDSFGMPHIYAQTDEDAFFALGYCMAQDRLFHMDLIRRAAKGQLAEVLGESLLPVDKLFRTITAGRSVEAIAATYPEESLQAMKAYAAGVNAYLKNHSGPLPVEFSILGYRPEPWHPNDGFAVHYYMAWDLNCAFEHEMLHAAVQQKVGSRLTSRIFPDYPQGAPTIMPEQSSVLNFLKTLHLARSALNAVGGGASNSWVVSGKKSRTGQPILANDPHLGHGVPGIWYEAHLVSPSLNVSGAYLPGLPYALIGANEHVAWGLTNVMTDDTDFYIEKINPENPDQYLFQGTWENMEIRKETIRIKGGRELPFQIRLTRHGPIIDTVNDYQEPSGTTLAMRWTAYEQLKAIHAFRGLNTAEDIEDIEKAVAFFKCPGQNWVYADDQGNIGFWAAAAIPIRDGFSGALPVPGWDGEHEWLGYVPTKQQPHLRNPDRGWIATANNKHLHDAPYPISHYYAMPDRFIRIREMLTAREKLGVEDFKAMHNDIYVILARDWVPRFLKALQGTLVSENEQLAASALKSWDLIADADQVAPSIFHALLNALVKNTFHKRLGPELYPLYLKNKYTVFNALRNLMQAGDSDWFDDPETSVRETFEDVVRLSFREALAGLERELGDQIGDWKWGDLHTLSFKHPFGQSSKLMGAFLNIGPFPIGGSFATVNPQAYPLNNPWEVKHGASLRYITDFANRENSVRIIPAGISGNVMSPHYDDQVTQWRTGRYRPFVLDRAAVLRDRKYEMKLLPD